MSAPGTATAPEPTTPTPPPPAWRSPRAWALLLALTLVGLAADLASKSIAFRTVAGAPVVVERADVIALSRAGRPLEGLLPFHEPRTVIPHVLEFQLVLNRGAVFGLGAGRRWIFVVFTGVAVCVGLWAFGRWTHARDRLAHASIALVLAGGLGNVYDRIFYACVRDFIHPLPGVPLPFGLHWPNDPSGEIWPWVSNVADLFLILGVGGLMLSMWKHPPAPASTAETPADASAGE